MTYKISYQKRFSQDGTVYDQMITAKCSSAEIMRFYYLGDRLWREYNDETGIYYPNLTERDIFIRHFGIEDKRFKKNRNTCIKILVV